MFNSIFHSPKLILYRFLHKRDVIVDVSEDIRFTKSTRDTTRYNADDLTIVDQRTATVTLKKTTKNIIHGKL